MKPVIIYDPWYYTVANAPLPDDPRVEIVEVQPETVVALRFSGLAGDETVAERRRDLLNALERSDWRPIGEPIARYYDPPWTLPFLRRNEVAIAVAPR